jgi:hypothetical protein
MSEDAGFFVKAALSVVPVIAFIVPEGASSALGLGALFAIWGIDWNGGASS